MAVIAAHDRDRAAHAVHAEPEPRHLQMVMRQPGEIVEPQMLLLALTRMIEHGAVGALQPFVDKAVVPVEGAAEFFSARAAALQLERQQHPHADLLAATRVVVLAGRIGDPVQLVVIWHEGTVVGAIVKHLLSASDETAALQQPLVDRRCVESF